MARILITTAPFGEQIRLPIDLLDQSGIEYLINPYGEKLNENQLIELVSDIDVIIAGTEQLNDRVLSYAKSLKFISRVGTGVDSVDLLSARKRGIKVSHTPDAPGPAVAELTIGLMISLLRHIHISNDQIKNGVWSRFIGRRISELSIGIIGVGRIGKGVISRLSAFTNNRILVNDINPNLELNNYHNLEWVDKDKIYCESDIISLHIPLTKHTNNMIRSDELMKMKSDAIIINTSRGGIINESDLQEVLLSGHLSGAAVDSFNEEPYSGPLKNIENCLLTAHMGSMSIDCRAQMEREATEEAIRFLDGKKLLNEVPEAEYIIQEQGI